MAHPYYKVARNSASLVAGFQKFVLFAGHFSVEVTDNISTEHSNTGKVRKKYDHLSVPFYKYLLQPLR